MFPEEFIKRIKTQKYIDSDMLLKSLEEPSPVSIRINRGKLQNVPVNSEPVPWCDMGYYLKSRPSFTLDPLFHSGCYYPREASGMFLDQVFSQVVKATENLRVLDLCAAPGGKSTQLSDLIGKNSMLISNEVIRQRSVILSETVTKWGKGNTIVTQSDPSAFAALPGYFDIIMIDAPCSGEGMFRDKTAINEWSPENTRLCEERQRRIISDVWPALKENGLLIYSTCTFNPGENEENISWLTRNRQSESLRLDINGLTAIEEIRHLGICGYGFYPGKVSGEGFFISVVRKTSGPESYKLTGQRKHEFFPDKADIRTIEKWITSDTGKVLKRGENLIMLPCEINEYLTLARTINVVRGGTLMAIRKRDDYLPSHELALSQDIKNDAFSSSEISFRAALAYLRRDNISLNDLHDGWNILTFKGVKLGFVKNLGKRINNYFPVAWRIRMDLPEPGMENIIRWTNEL